MFAFVTGTDWAAVRAAGPFWINLGLLAALAYAFARLLTDRGVAIWVCDHPSLAPGPPLLPVQAALVGLIGLAAGPAAWVAPPEALPLVCAGASVCVLVLAHDLLKDKQSIRRLSDPVPTVPPAPAPAEPPTLPGGAS